MKKPAGNLFEKFVMCVQEFVVAKTKNPVQAYCQLLIKRLCCYLLVIENCL